RFVRINKMKGIFTAKKKDGTTYYRASVTYKGKHISIGSSESIEEASKLYENARLVIRDPELTPDKYSAEFKPLSFHKFICIANLRDNNIYIKTPIYLHRTYFSYYLDTETELKFDLEDLFYYSSHTIQRRGKHLFVADFGLQERILSRYDIPGFAVLGKDYRFKNGDHTDLRYGNVEVINPVKNIRKRTEGRDEVYNVKMHIVGDWNIGSYPTHQMAIIAYNKALDEAKKHGFKTRTERIDIPEGLSPSLYARLYSTIELPAKYIEYLEKSGDPKDPDDLKVSGDPQRSNDPE
ncbi:MAG: hypothetical protein K6G42_08125, partial [Lachnospiraceae bacterium]|nr:hypothetical protein [Lachnospiraceae bacterium]